MTPRLTVFPCLRCPGFPFMGNPQSILAALASCVSTSCTLSSRPCDLPASETVQETLVRLRWWKTQLPKSPLSGGLSTQFPPYQGDFPLNSLLIRGTFHSIPSLSGGLSTQFPPYQGDFPLNSPLIRGARGVKNDERWVFCTVSFAGMAAGMGFCSPPARGQASQE